MPKIEIIYLDETAIDENLIPIKGYSKKNYPFIV